MLRSRLILVCAALWCLASAAAGDTLTWRNSSSDFNLTSSWRNTNLLGPDRVPTGSDLADFSGIGSVDPVLTSTTAVFGVRFGSAVSGVASDYVLSSSATAQLVVLGSGIAGSNSSGTNTISASLVLNDDQAITQAAGGTLNITGPAVLGGNTSGGTQGSALTVGSTSTSGVINFAPSSVELAGHLTLTTHVDVTLPAVALLNAPGTTAGITKQGQATLTLSGPSTYDGPTDVNAGTLLATNTTGSATGSGPVAVNGGAVLGGSGSLAGPTTVAAGGTITGGDVGSVGALTLQSVSFVGTAGDYATYLVDLTSGGSDRLSLIGNLDLAGTFDRIQFSGTAGAPSYQLATYSGSRSGTFDSVDNLPAGYVLQYDSGSINLVAVPEPATWLAGAAAFAAAAWSQRRRFAAARMRRGRLA